MGLEDNIGNMASEAAGGVTDAVSDVVGGVTDAIADAVSYTHLTLPTILLV